MTPTAATFFSSGNETSWTQFLIVGLIVAVATSLFRWLRKRRNAPGFKALEARYGGVYVSEAKARAERFPGEDWDAPRRGMYQVEDYLTGSYQGHRFYCFGWVHELRSSDVDVVADQAPVSRSVYTMELPGHVGCFSVRKHSAARRMFGQNDVQVGHPEFDEHFTVRSEEPSVAQQVLRGDLLNFLLNDPRSRDYPLWFLGDRLVCSERSRFNPDDAEPVLAYLAEVLGHLGPAAPRAQSHDALDQDVVPVA